MDTTTLFFLTVIIIINIINFAYTLYTGRIQNTRIEDLKNTLNSQIKIQNARIEDLNNTLYSQIKIQNARIKELEDTLIPSKTFESIGITVSPLTSSIMSKFDVKNGIYIKDVKKFSEGYNKGLYKELVILEADKQLIKDTDQFNSIISKKNGGDVILLKVKIQDGNFRLISVEIKFKKLEDAEDHKKPALEPEFTLWIQKSDEQLKFQEELRKFEAELEKEKDPIKRADLISEEEVKQMKKNFQNVIDNIKLKRDNINLLKENELNIIEYDEHKKQSKTDRKPDKPER